MKVDISRLKKGTSEVPTECQTLIDRLRSCSTDELLVELQQINTWTFGKSELYHWIDILDKFDGILEEATRQIGNDWFLACDERFSPKKCQLLLAVLNFTTLLIEHSFSRHLYNSVEHLTQLLSSTNMEIVLGVLNLLYMFSKRSNFIPRLNCSKRNALLARLTYIAESWGGKEHGYGLAECCCEDMKPSDSFPKFYYEYYDNNGKLKSIEQDEFSDFIGITNASEIAYLMCRRIPIPLDDDQKMLIFTRVRLSLSFHDYNTRMQFVLARLQALSVLVYSNSLQENINSLLYPGFLEELVELLEIRELNLVEIRAAALRTLTSIIHLDRNPHFPKKPGSRLMMIIDVTGAASYHGFLPTLVRTCIQYLTTTSEDKEITHDGKDINNSNQAFPLALATALFSFLYHLASYDSGGEALVSCGMMESLLRVINWPGKELEHITFVTRAVRVIDLITNIEMQSFQIHGGLQSFINRLDLEVNICREEQPSELIPTFLDRSPDNSFLVSEDAIMYEGNLINCHGTNSGSSNVYGSNSLNNENYSGMKSRSLPDYNNTSSSSSSSLLIHQNHRTQQQSSQAQHQLHKINRSCLPQRAALLKSMLNFLKKAIQDSAFSESIRHVMESSLPTSLRHIISNAEYYGPSLFLLATDVVTVYVFQEPSLLYSLQDSGLTDVVLQALLKKDVPPTREVLGSLPNVFSALCLNARGLSAFVQYKPFDRLFEVLLSPVYLQAMRRRRSSDPMGDTASNLGNAMDELMRHQPSLKTEATKAIIRLLEELVKLGTNEKYICWRTQNNKSDENVYSTSTSGSNHINNNNGRQSIHVRVLQVNNSINRSVNNSGHHGAALIADRVENVGNNINASSNNVGTGTAGNDAGSSDEDDDDEEEASTSSHHNQRDVCVRGANNTDLGCSREAAQELKTSSDERIPIPLIDYILNVMKFVDAILSNNSTDDHCREFVSQGGLQPLLRVLALPNLPVDSPITASAQAVAAVCKSILSLAHEPQVLQVALEQLASVVDQLEPLQSHWEKPQGSVLLRELANCKNINTAFSNASDTPLLHAMSAVHGYVVMLVHVCRTGQNEIRNLLIERWGQNNKYGQKLLYKLVQLYTALVWESTLLLALCTDDIIPVGCDFGKEDLEKLPKDIESTIATDASANQDNDNDKISPTAPFGSNTATVTSVNNLLHENSMDIDRVLNLIDTSSGVNNANTPSATNATTTTTPTSSESSETESPSYSNETVKTKSVSNDVGNKNFIPKENKSDDQSTQRKIIATQSQLKYIKSLLGASSRLGRALAELFGLLVKLCVGNRIRMRHPQNIATNYMSSASRDIARVLSYILVDGLSHHHLPPSPIIKLKQTFLICSIGFTSPMLFDEKRYAYHLMLHKFCEEGGLQAFFEMFDFALNIEPVSIPDEASSAVEKNKKLLTDEKITKGDEKQPTLSSTDTTFKSESLITPMETTTKEEDHGEFPPGSGEFLDAWLMLLEKMVNPKAILESPHVITSKSVRNKAEFDTVAYLINVHRLAFQTVTKIWSYKPIRTYGPRMTESMLTILKHIYKGESILREKYNKKVAEQASAEKAPAVGKFVGKSSTSLNQYDTNNVITNNQSTQALGLTQPNSSSNSGVFGGTTASQPPVNEAHLSQLMDMGFLQEHCREALYYAASVEQATEYLLANTFSNSATQSLANNNSSNNNNTASNTNRSASSAATDLQSNLPIDSDDDDDDENVDAEMVVLMAPKLLPKSSSRNDSNEKNNGGESSKSTNKNSRRGMRLTQVILSNDPPLSEELLTNFSEEAVKTCLYLIDQVPDAVFKGAELLAILFKRSEIKWKTLASIIGTINECIEQLLLMLYDQSFIETMFFGELSCQFAVRLHILSIFLEGQYADLRTPTFLSIKEFKLMPNLIRLLNKTEEILTAKAAKFPCTPKWLSQMILLIDLYEKVAVLIRRRNEMHRITTHIWKWYDVASGKWNAYSVSNNKIINDAYWAGESSVRVSVGRHRYTINFNCMSQVNEETGNHRPVVLGLLSSIKRLPATLSYIFGSDNDDGLKTNAENDNSGTSNGSITTKKPKLHTLPTNPPGISASLNEYELDRTTAAALLEMRENHRLNNFKTDYTESVFGKTLEKSDTPSFTASDVRLYGLEEFSTDNIVATCVRLMSPNILIDRDSLHALMKLCVRLTTKYENAEVFAREGGIKLLLQMKQTSGYIGFSTLANLLIRHTLEEPRTLAMAMEKVIAARTLQTIPPGYRDLIFMLRRMSSAVARDPEVFKQVARSMLRIDVNALRRGVFSEDYRLIMKSITPPNLKRQFEKPIESSMIARVVYELLQALVVPVAAAVQSTEEKAGSTLTKITQQKNNANIGIFNVSSTITGTTAAAGTSNNEGIEDTLFHHHRSFDDTEITFIESNSAESGLSPSMSLRIGTSPSETHRIDIGGRFFGSRNTPQSSGTVYNNIASSPPKPQQQQQTHEYNNINVTKSESDKPLLPKSTILKALAEAVRSYQTVGIIIAEYVYQPQPNTLIRHSQPALAFILDNLLPSSEQNPDRECSPGARMLIAALSAAVDSQATQYAVVTEVRAAILRALTWSETPEKHQQLQLLTALIPTMIENCPPDNPALVRLHQHQPRRNDIFNIMVRKGLITDLANITQNLDLSSPHTILTIGTALKSLEQLLRMSNQPVNPISLQLNKNRNNETEANDASNTVEPQISRRQSNAINETTLSDRQDEQEERRSHEENTEEMLEDNPTNPSETITTSEPIAEFMPNTENTSTNPEQEDNSIPLTQGDNDDRDLINVNDNIVAQVEAIESTMEELMEHFLDRDPLIDESQPSHTSMNSGTTTRDSVTGTSAVTAGSSSNTGVSLRPMELTEDRFIIEEDDTSSDSESNASEENDEDREEEMDEDENEDEAEDRSDLEVDEETRQFIEMYDHVYGRHLSPSIPELERDGEDILMIQYADNERDVSGNADNVAGIGNSVAVSNNIIDDENEPAPASNIANNIPSTTGISRVNVNNPSTSSGNERTSPNRFLLHANFPNIFESSNIARHTESASGNGDASNESATPGSPNASNVNIGGVHISTGIGRSGIISGNGNSSNHPNSLSQMIQFRTTQRNSNRQRRCAYLNLNGRSTNPPAILQRLLGPSVAQNVNIGLGQVIANANGSASFRDATRVVVMDNGFGIFANASEPSIDLFDQGGYLFGRSLAATLNSTPSPLHWWLEEAKILGLESQADVCLTVCNDLIPDLEAQRSLEISKTRGKRKKKSTGENGSTTSDTSQKQKNAGSTSTSNDIASDATPVTRTNATITNNNENEARSEGLPNNGPSDASESILNQLNNNTEAREADHEESYDSEEIEEIDDSEQVDEDDGDDDNSSKNDEDLEIEETNNLNLNESQTNAGPNNDNDDENENDLDEEDEDETDVESNEEMTESDCNIHEEESNQNDDEENGEGSASDSGRSIASSVSTEPFFQVGQASRQQTEQQQQQSLSVPQQQEQEPLSEQLPENHEQQQQQLIEEQQQQSEHEQKQDLILEEKQQQQVPASTAQSTSSVIASTHQTSNNEKPELLSYEEICGLNKEKYLGSILPSIDVLQPLTIQLEQTSLSTVSDNGGVSDFDEVQKILKVINTEFKEQESLPTDHNEKCDEDDQDENNENESELSQEPKRQRLQDSNNTIDENAASASDWDPSSWQPRRRVLRGRRVVHDNSTLETTEQEATAGEIIANISAQQRQSTHEPTVGETLANAAGAVATTTTTTTAATATAITTTETTEITTSTTSNSENSAQSSSTTSQNSSQIPDGIDPSFLAALPEEMRAEVIAEHLRIQRMQERTRIQQQAAIQNEQSVIEVNPEFLAALPPNIQEEVLAQQRIEQQRQAAATANPNDPVDAAAFFQNLQPSLRQAILTDMEDSQISVLPPELAAEAQNLRRDWESRNRQIMQEQINQMGGSGGGGNVGTSPSLSSVLRYRSRLPEPIFSAHNLQRMRWSNWGFNSGISGISGEGSSSGMGTGRDLLSSGSNILADLRMEQQGRPILDHESLASLLILLFVEANKICTLRFHRVIRNLCYHVPTRDWIIRTILSIIEKSNIQGPLSEFPQSISTRPQWLNIRLDAALGNRNNIFIINRNCETPDLDLLYSDTQAISEDILNVLAANYSIAIHPQAAHVVCRHALDLLISLAKNFPANFLPIRKKGQNNQNESSSGGGKTESKPSTSKIQGDLDEKLEEATDFWKILLRLELKAQKNKRLHKGKPVSDGSHSASSGALVRAENFVETEVTSFSDSPFGQLISMLSFDIILKSTILTDKLLRLLSFISIGLPDAIHQSQLAIPTSLHVPPTHGAQSSATNEPKTSEKDLNNTTASNLETPYIDDKYLPESQKNIRLAIEVLTQKSCSEEGLEDATSLLLNLSQCSNTTRLFILNLLIDGAKYLAGVVQSQINNLIRDLRKLNSKNRNDYALNPSGSQFGQVFAPFDSSEGSSTSNNLSEIGYSNFGHKFSTSSSKGILQDRFTKETVVITSTSKQKTRCELQLPSMVPLISKTASQSFFLRILKVIIQIRESAKEALSKETTSSQNSTTSSSGLVSNSATTQTNNSAFYNVASTSSNITFDPITTTNNTRNVNESSRPTPSKKIVLNPIELQPLSETLQLDHLWDTLSDCLVELEENADHHAVLVLQPAVEAFFLVHASSTSKSSHARTESRRQTTESEHSVASDNRGLRAESTETERRSDTQNVSTIAEEQNTLPGPVDSNAPTDSPSDSATNTTENTEPQEDQSSSDASKPDLTQRASTSDTHQQSQKSLQLTTNQKKFLQFAEKHRTVLNQILRQSTVHLSDGPFAVLVDHTRILDFDVKRRYFRTELERMDEGIRREELAVHVHRVTVFEDSFRELYRRNPEEWKNRFYIVFEDEEGQDAGGLLREWYVIISREIFNPMYALFTVSPGDRVTYMINPSSHANSNHLFYFKFVGRVIAKAIYDNKLLECYFTRSFYKHILGIEVNTQDMENEDYEFYKGLVYLMENHVSALGYEQTFSLEVQEFGVTEVRDLIANGRNVVVTEENKSSYIHMVCQLKMSGSIRKQLNAFLEGFYDIIPKRLISIFNEQELELLISGLPNVDIEDLKANTEYHKYQANSIQIQWFWRALRSFDQAERAKFLQFVTGTSKVPLQGFAALEGMNGTQKFQIHRDDRSTERLPSAHTCFNQLDLPVYKTYDKLRSSLLKAIHECSEGFGFA